MLPLFFILPVHKVKSLRKRLYFIPCVPLSPFPLPSIALPSPSPVISPAYLYSLYNIKFVLQHKYPVFSAKLHNLWGGVEIRGLDLSGGISSSPPSPSAFPPSYRGVLLWPLARFLNKQIVCIHVLLHCMSCCLLFITLYKRTQNIPTAMLRYFFNIVVQL